MLYTIIFYILLYIVAVANKNNCRKAIKYVCIISAIYMGIRYDYCPDYPAYQRMFEEFSRPDFVYTDDIHLEYGWYLLNKWCSPIGYLGFVFLSSCIYAYALYCLLDLKVTSKYVAITILGCVSAGGFTTLLSAQRQMLVAALFMIGYKFLLANRLEKWRDLLKWRSIVYYVLIIVCSYFHRSALFLLIVPFVFILPRQSYLVLFGVVALAFSIVTFGSTYITDFFQSYSEEYDYYSYLNWGGNTWAGSLTIAQGIMWLVLFLSFSYCYINFNLSKTEQSMLLISMLAIIITLSGYYLPQVGRLAHYFYCFTYVSIALVCQKFQNKKFYLMYYCICWVWVLWNCLKIFTINVGTFQEYKTIFNVLL